jgi:septum formation protein
LGLVFDVISPSVVEPDLRGADPVELARARGLVEVERTRVTLRAMNDVEIAWYVNTGEPMDKAGAYAAQGLGALFITEFQGCFYNVVGLPLVRLASMTARLGRPLLSFCPPGSRVREPSGSSLDSS